MGNLRDRLKENAEKSEEIEDRNRSKRTGSASIETALQSAHEELKSKVESFAKDGLASIESGMASFRESALQSIERNNATLQGEMDKSLKQAGAWSRWGLVLWSKTGAVLMVWAALLVILTGWTMYVRSELPTRRAELAELKEQCAKYENERETLALIRDSGIVIANSLEGGALLQVSAKAKLRPSPNGKAQWLVVPETKKDAAR